MTKVYFVRHAQPVHSWKDDRTRPLTDEGVSDSKKVTDLLKTAAVDCFYLSPYKRCIDTIYESADFYGMSIALDERLKECKYGNLSGNFHEVIKKRWNDFAWHEGSGEPLGDVQNRNISAVYDILTANTDKTIVIGTHATALSVILNYFNSVHNSNDYFRIVNFTPYIIRLDFKENDYVGQEELLIIHKDLKY